MAETKNSDIPSVLSCQTCPSRSHSPFDGLTKEEIRSFESARISNVYQRGQTIFFEGNRPLAMHCLNRGTVKLFRKGPDDRETIVHLAKPGEVLGYGPLMTGDPYSYTAEAVEESVICAIDKAAILPLLETSPRLLRALLEDACHSVHASMAGQCSLAQKSVRERMAETLLWLSESHGSPTETGGKIHLRLTRQEIADLTGTVLETAVRLLSEFRKDRWIEIDGQEITILDRSALLRTANLGPL